MNRNDRTPIVINLERLLKLQMLVVRFGEMGIATLWNTNGQLGCLGAATFRLGFSPARTSPELVRCSLSPHTAAW